MNKRSIKFYILIITCIFSQPILSSDNEIEQDNNKKLVLKTPPPTQDLGYFANLPLELTHKIITLSSIKTMMEVSKFFYSFITGYDQIGLRGIENKPVFSTLDYDLFMSRPLPAYEDRNMIPSFVWFNVAKDFNITFETLEYLSYLELIRGNNIHTIDLEGCNEIGENKIRLVAASITNMPCLRIINLENSALQDNEFKLLANSILNTNTLSLKTINIYNTTNLSGYVLFYNATTMQKKYPELEVLFNPTPEQNFALLTLLR